MLTAAGPMVYIGKVYTKFGDDGETMLASGETVAKDCPRVRAYGEVDELNACVGAILLELGREGTSEHLRPFGAEVAASLHRIQHELFNLGAELATAARPGDDASPPRLRIEARHVLTLEEEIDRLNAELEPLRSFILPGGGPAGTAAHLARTVCRRAEREVVALAAVETVAPDARRYLNRLSDYLFVLARACARRFGHAESLWDPATT